MNQLTRNIPSTEVAEMVGRDHNEVLKDIRRIINQLGEGIYPSPISSNQLTLILKIKSYLASYLLKRL